MSTRSPISSWFARVALLHAIVTATGCREERATPSADRAPSNPGIRAGSRANHPALPLASDGGGFVDHQLALRVAQFGGAMIAAGPTERGSLAQGGRASHDLEMIGNHCYRILAVGGVEVNDLGLAIFGPDGAELDEDTEGGDYPALGTARPICPPSPGRYRVEVRMRSGQGDYAVVAVRTP